MMALGALVLVWSLYFLRLLAEDNSSELRLVGGASRCAGTVEVRLRGEWRRVYEPFRPWDVEHIAAVCRDLDCGSAVYREERNDFPESPVWEVDYDCVMKSAVRECVDDSSSSSSSWGLEVKCSDSVRLVSGPSLCSGSVQIWNQSWTWVCEGALDQQGAEVLCRELGCGAPSLLQGALSPLGQRFHCEGHESALMECPRSGSETCSSGAAVNLTCSELRLVGGASRCAGTVEVRLRGEWRRVYEPFRPWDVEHIAAVCRDLDCGSAVYREERNDFPESPVWEVDYDCVMKSAVRECVDGSSSSSSSWGLEVKCSDSVRLVSGPSLCSGSVQIWNQSWTWVCEGALDQQGAEVLCRELGCGAPSLLQGALSPLKQRFHCEGHESALMDCPRSGSETCSSGAAVNLTCSELRLVGGASRCAGTVEVRLRGEWRRVYEPFRPWDVEHIAAVCRDLDCGSAVYREERNDFPESPVWEVDYDCVMKSAVRECVDGSSSSSSSWGLEVKCSDSVRLVSGPSLCSGSVQIWNQSWTWVCEGALDQQGAEVLCRELGCGAPSLLQGALSPLKQRFHCEGHESALMDCPRSGSETCSSGAAVNLTCSELRLVGGASRCAGTVEVRHRGEWRRVYEPFRPWDVEHIAAVCRDLDCGSAVYREERNDFPESPVWEVDYDCVMKSAVRECVDGSSSSSWGLEVKCSDSVRLVSGPSLCSGSVQIWNQSWTWVCEGALDQQGAEVLCRELGCGAPSLLQGALSLLKQKFHCEGHESALMDCRRSGSETCSSGAAVNLTCSEPLRLVGGASRCAGTVEVRHKGEWRRAESSRFWDLENTAAVCRDLDCGSAVYGEERDGFPQSPVWMVPYDCVKESAVRDCVIASPSSPWGLEVKCSDSVRLVSGPSLCSGSVQIWNQSWTWVCEGALDQQGTEVLCRELGCGAPSLLQGALSPLKQKFHCEGHESALMDCPRSGSETCSSGAAVNLTCSEPLRLVGGASRCAGTVEVRHRGEWRRVEPSELWVLEHTAAVCRDLDCGSAVYGEKREDFPQSPMWWVSPHCVKKSAVRECVFGSFSPSSLGLEVKCSGPPSPPPLPPCGCCG
ncbi:deleted in malignant brain tumors 1 protein-like [Periophthalmus magnuspinnatus]|uniref:deleted in malignant brain tumors 1 protein-like n=1 Tax=Periophthalmus magnuspinnatus TaxID=409849 RepID=UPI0024364DF5|nr:deleted in malignant brain tumors 1 protein-like [Periophthalmus magnuspinnatus]